MTNPFDTDPEIIVDQLRQHQLRWEQQMATYAEFEAAGWQVSDPLATPERLSSLHNEVRKHI